MSIITREHLEILVQLGKRMVSKKTKDGDFTVSDFVDRALGNTSASGTTGSTTAVSVKPKYVTLDDKVTELNLTDLSGGGSTFTLILTQGTGANKIKFKETVKWMYGALPVLSYVKGNVDILQFYLAEDGVTWLGGVTSGGYA